jgi:hypothetical protein
MMTIVLGIIFAWVLIGVGTWLAYQLVRSGATAGSPSSASTFPTPRSAFHDTVPEPSSLATCLLAVACCIIARDRRAARNRC